MRPITISVMNDVGMLVAEFQLHLSEEKYREAMNMLLRPGTKLEEFVDFISSEENN